MQRYLPILITAVLLLPLYSALAAGLKIEPYPQVHVTVGKAYKPDAAFQKMQRIFSEATAKKDSVALFALVGPTFVWTVDGGLTEKFDMGRDASYNFKVLFGFRAPGADTDGGVVDGPRWDVLTAFAADGSYSQVTEGGNLVCSPISAEFDDEEYQRAREAIEPDDDGVEWYFTTTEVTVTKSPDNHSPPIGQLNGIAVPLLDVFPAAVENQPTPPATYVKILMPSGKVGWIPAEVARPLSSDRLCYAKTPSGEWKIVAFDQSGN